MFSIKSKLKDWNSLKIGSIAKGKTGNNWLEITDGT